MGARRRIQLLVALGMVFVFMATPVCAAEKPIKLNWVSFVATNNYIYKLVQECFIDKVNELAKGELVIKFRGGPETFSPFDIPKVVQDGVVDIGTTFAGAIEPVVPGVQASMLSELTMEEERQPGGAYDFLLDMYKKRGIYYLGRGTNIRDGFFYTVLRDKKIERPQDLKGLTMEGTTAAQAPARGWGCTYTLIHLADAYTAMERGVVDALQGRPASGYYHDSVYEVAKYIVDPPIYNSTDRVFMNLESFNKLPEHLQKLLVDTFIEAEKEMGARAEGIEDEDLQWMLDKGHLELIQFSPEDAKWYVDSANEAAWEYQQKRFPDVTPKLKELFTK